MFSLILENQNNNSINLNDELNYILLDVGGLTPPSATLFTSKSPNRKGLKHNGSTLNERNITLSIKVLGDIEKNRNALYDFVSTEQYVKILYKNGLKNVYCEGYVEECEGSFFTDSEVLEVAIVCGDPYWKELIEMATQISQILHQFIFPFSIDKEGVPFSTVKESTETIINNLAVETGVTISILFNGTVVNPAIYDSNDPSKFISLKTTFTYGEVVIIKTDGSPKTIKKYLQNGDEENILKYANNNISWFTLKKGINKFNYSADSGIENMQIVFSFSNKYLGV